jgi:hypothetical protein
MPAPSHLPSSGEFKLGINRPSSNAAVIFDNNLWLIGHGGSNDLWQTTFNLGKNFNDRFQNQSSWKNAQISPPGGAHTSVRCGADVSAGTQPGLYLFWVGDKSRLNASCCTASNGGGSPDWGQAASLFERGTNVTVDGTAEVAATAFGLDTFIVATLASGGSLFLGAYNTNDCNNNPGHWESRSAYRIEKQDLISLVEGALQQQEPQAQVHGFTGTISIAWSSSLPGAPGGNPPINLTDAPPSFFLAVFLRVSAKHVKGNVDVPIVISLDSSGNAISGSAFCMNPLTDDAMSPFSVVRDTPGRLLAFCTLGESKGLGCQGYATETLPVPGQAATFTGFEAGENVDAHPPTVVYFVDVPTVPGTSPSDIIDCPVYQFAFYNSDVRCQFDYFGYIEVNNKFDTLIPQPPNTIFVPTGIIDGPIPLPNENIKDYVFGPGSVDLGDVTYGFTSSTTHQHQSSCAWTAGFKSTGSTGKGVGPAWDIAVSGGMGSVSGKAEGTINSSEMVQGGNVSTRMEGSENVGVSVVPEGTIGGSPITIQVVTYTFFDSKGQIVADATTADSGQAMKSAFFQAKSGSLDVQNYTPFLTTAGNLRSYTPEAINTKMTNLGYNKTGDYFHDVIVANAYTFGNGQKYLSFSWTADGKTSASFQATATSFEENSWSFDTSVYAGISTGEGFNVFGMGESFQYKFMAGFTMSTQSSTTTTDGSSWGIQLSQNWGPPGWGGDPSFVPVNCQPNWPKAMANFSFVLYFLPIPAKSSGLPKNYWTWELKEYLPKVPNQIFKNVENIDINAAAWRIVYVVTAYTTNDGSLTYSYSGSLS